MARLHLIAAASALLLLSLAPAAHAEQPLPGPPTAAQTAAAANASPPAPGAREEAAPMLPGQILRMLNALSVIGVAEIDKSSALISSSGIADTAKLPVHEAIWVSPEPPTMPLFFSRVVKLKF